MTVTRTTSATRRQVWEVLADGWLYPSWVVGASRMRAVDPHWPATGSRLSHSVGTWPALLDDDTRVESATPEEELVLIARAWPVGEARVTVQLSDAEQGARIEMSEVAQSGPARLLPESVQRAAVEPRNRECLLRLALIAERNTPTDGG